MGGAGMMLLSEAAKVLDAALIGEDVRFTSVSTDSRKIAAGDLFIALHGENFDGTKFVEAAAEAGAAAAMVNAGSHSGEATCPLLLVGDTRLALGRLAAHWREQFEIPVVGLTGSNGKTTVKEMLAAILAAAAGGSEYVLATQGNLNNDIGMPLTLLRMSQQHKYAVIEMGMNHPGEIDYLTHIARPDVAIINNAAGAHLEGLGTVEAVARAKGEIFAGLEVAGTAVINADDVYEPMWKELAAGHTVIRFGLGGAATVRGRWQPRDGGLHLEVATPSGEMLVSLRVPGEHNARNALAATAAAIALQVPMVSIVQGLESFGGVAGRLQRMEGKNGAVIIDDTYNANPSSMRAAIDVLAQVQGKRIFVMGDMGELGAEAPRFHAEIGAAVKAAGIPVLFALGKLSREAVRAFGAGAHHFDDAPSLNEALEKELGKGVTVLVKGSRSMKMEQVVNNCITEEACCSH